MTIQAEAEEVIHVSGVAQSWNVNGKVGNGLQNRIKLNPAAEPCFDSGNVGHGETSFMLLEGGKEIALYSGQHACMYEQEFLHTFTVQILVTCI
jgi:hypothetical protein